MIFQIFVIGAVVSFLGSLPPGTLNVSVLQLGLEQKIKPALRFALAVTLVEYPYAWIAVAFEGVITTSPVVAHNLKLLAAAVMISLGLLGLWSARKPSAFTVRLQESGFRRGLVLSLLNPQAIPWWIGMIAYLKSQGWIALDTMARVQSFSIGTAVGTMLLLTLLAYTARWISGFFQHSRLLAIFPSVLLLILGTIALVSYFF